jgi:hypothetical protein
MTLVVCITLTGIALAAIAALCGPGVAGAASASVVASSSGTADCTSLTTCYSATSHASPLATPLARHASRTQGHPRATFAEEDHLSG